MKVYAKQIAPEYQESPLFIDGCFPNNIAVCGNRDFNTHKPEIFEKVQTVLEQGELAEVLGMSVSAVSHQLRILRGAKLVKAKKEGKEVRYSLDDDHVNMIMECGLTHVNEDK